MIYISCKLTSRQFLILYVFTDHMQKYVFAFAFYCLLWRHPFFYWDCLMKLKSIFHRGLPHEILKIFHRGKKKGMTYCYKNYMFTCYYIIKNILVCFLQSASTKLEVGWMIRLLQTSAASNDALICSLF